MDTLTIFAQTNSHGENSYFFSGPNRESLKHEFDECMKIWEREAEEECKSEFEEQIKLAKMRLEEARTWTYKENYKRKKRESKLLEISQELAYLDEYTYEKANGSTWIPSHNGSIPLDLPSKDDIIRCKITKWIKEKGWCIISSSMFKDGNRASTITVWASQD